MDFKKIPVGKNAPETVNCVIEIPRDTNQKYEFDEEIQAFRLDRILKSAMRYLQIMDLFRLHLVRMVILLIC